MGHCGHESRVTTIIFRTSPTAQYTVVLVQPPVLVLYSTGRFFPNHSHLIHSTLNSLLSLRSADQYSSGDAGGGVLALLYGTMYNRCKCTLVVSIVVLVQPTTPEYCRVVVLALRGKELWQTQEPNATASCQQQKPPLKHNSDKTTRGVSKSNLLTRTFYLRYSRLPFDSKWQRHRIATTATFLLWLMRFAEQM